MTPLRKRMLEDMGIRNFAENTQLSYLQQVSSFAKFFDCSPPPRANIECCTCP
jgi:hypothetical protein